MFSLSHIEPVWIVLGSFCFPSVFYLAVVQLNSDPLSGYFNSCPTPTMSFIVQGFFNVCNLIHTHRTERVTMGLNTQC